MIEQTIPKELLELSTVQQDNEDNLLDLPNVVGVALGNRIRNEVETDEPVISVLVSQKTPPELLRDNERVPRKIKGAATDVVEVGDIFAEGTTVTVAEKGEEQIEEEEILREEPLREIPVPEIQPQAAPSPSLTRRMRPAMGGFSVGPYRGPTGTIATGCYDLTPFPGMPQKYYILSNNHVLAGTNRFPLGWPILQPGHADGGTYPRDMIGRLSRYVTIHFISGPRRPTNQIDAAIAEVNLQDLGREIFWVGHVQRLYTAPRVGDIVEKAGRTTGFTTGRVRNVNATVNVNYGGGRVARFARQIITTRMSAPGDSGSLVTDRDEGAVGLLFAGSPTVTILNNILFVQSRLRIRLTEK